MTFKTELQVLEVFPDIWMLDKDLVYEGKHQTFRVPRTYYTDFASVPRFLTWLIPTTGKYTKAAVVHDYLCDTLKEYHESEAVPAHWVSSRDADGIFRRMMRELGVPKVRRWLMWAGVRWGAVFSAHRREDVWKDMHLVLLLTLLAAPFVIPAAALAALSYLVYLVVEKAV